MNKPKRNQLCPCGSNKKFKKCCTISILRNRKIIAWLQDNDPAPPINYSTITVEEMDDDFTTDILKNRVKEILHSVRVEKTEKFLARQSPGG